MQLSTLIRRAARYYGDQVAAIDQSRRLSFREVDDRSDRLANVLGELGLRPGDRFAVLLPNCVEHLELEFAAIKGGFVRVPLNIRLSAEEYEFILSDSGARVLITTPSFLPVVEGLRERLPELSHVIVAGGDPAVHTVHEQALAQASSAPPVWQPTPEAPLFILYTSGTTGRPKGAVGTHRSKRAGMINMLTDELRVSPGDVMVHVGSMAHGSGSKALAFFVRGAANCALPKFDPEQFCETVQQHRGTHSFMVPTMVNMLIHHPAVEKYDLSSLRHVTYGGSPMPREVAAAAVRRLGPIFVQVYGSCEAPHPVLVLGQHDHQVEGTDRRRLETAGRESVGVEVRVVDTEGNPMPPGEPGELQVRGENVMAGYWRRPEATAEVIQENGWYATGDVARISEDGYVTIVDRKRDMIISGGYNVYPAEVEAVLHRHPAVLEAAVFGVPDDRWGEAVKAVVVLSHQAKATEAELIQFCRDHMASYKKPSSVEFRTELPKGATGKIAKKELRAAYWDGRSRQVN